MKHLMLPIAIVVLLGAATLQPATVAQDALPTPRGQLGGREPLELTPAPPLPPPVPTARATVPPVPTATPSPSAVPTATPSATPIEPVAMPTVPAIAAPNATPATTSSRPVVAAEAATTAASLAAGIAASPSPENSTADGDQATASVAQALEAAVPTVVTVLVDGPAGLRVGTGVVVVDARHVVASAALVGDARVAVLVHADGTRTDASVVGVDAASGIALLEAALDVAAPMPLSARGVATGDAVVGVGTADGAYPSTVVVGTVGFPSRAVAEGPPATLLIQHDAALPGRSWGAALVGFDGTLVGLTIPLARAGGEAGGIVLPPDPTMPMPGTPPQPAPGEPPIQLPVDRDADLELGVGDGGPLAFAVPAATIGRVVPDLLDDGAVAYPFLGVLFEPNEVWPGGPPDGTITIVEALPDGPAAAAGIRAGDVVVGFDGGALTPTRPFQLALFAREPGQAVSVTIARDGVPQEVEAVLGERPDA